MSAVDVRASTACLHELIETEAQRQPDAVAVACGEEQLTYEALIGRANALARRLVEAGVGPDSRVGVYLTHSVDLAAALLGVLKAGGAYLPLDPSFPVDRVQQALGDATVTAVVTTSELVARLPTPQPVVRMEDLPESEDAANLGHRAAIDNLAYVMYTSGSTGQPKGVLIPHRSVVEGYAAWEEAYRLRSKARVHCQMGSFAFGVFHLDFVRALCSGGTLVLCPPAIVMSPPQLYEVMERHRVDFAEFVPAALRGLVRHCHSTGRSLDFLNTLVVGSDRWYMAEHRALRSLCRPDARIIHSFGLTETGDTAYFDGSELPLPDGQLVPIGKPFPNIRAYVLDADLSPVPDGDAGELFIGGSSIARGLSNRSDVTAERFIPDPFSEGPGARMYRTGDQARVLADGNIEFLGRLDQMVKIRGFRVEPGEVEVALKAHPTVADSVVVPRDDASGATGLIAYVVPAVGDGATVTALRQHLLTRLPAYMMPTAFVRLGRLPLTPSGKVDRLALPAPGRGRPDLAQPFLPPRDPRERAVAEVFAGVLGIDEVGAEDNFFELGGHSLLAAMAASRLAEAHGVDLRVRDVFDYPVVARLAQRLPEAASGQKTPSTVAVSHVPFPSGGGKGGGAAPLSFAQQQLWLLDQLEPQSPLYNEFELLPFTGPLDLGALARSLTELRRRHEVLRTTFEVKDGEPVQVVGPADEVTLDVVDLSRAPVPERAARELCLNEVQRPFDLAKGPLFRASLMKLGPREHWLLLSMHHVVIDAWSIDVLRKELRAVYAEFAAGDPSPLPALPVQYADYAVWQRQQMQGEVLQRELAYWKQQLEAAPDIMALPTDRARPRVQSYRGATQHRLLPTGVAVGLREVGRRAGASLFMTTLAAFAVLLHRHTGETDLVLGSPVANRTRPEVEGLLGYFVNTLVLRTKIKGDECFRELLGRVRDMTLSAYEHQELPFAKLVEMLRPERALSHNPLFQVFFSHQITTDPMPVPAWQPVIPMAKFDLALFVKDAGDRVGLACEYSTDLFDDSTVTRLLDHLLVLLDAIVEDAERPVRELPLLTAAERQRLLVEWNQTEAPYQRDACLHQLFEARVRQTPDAVAARFEGETLSYAELNRRANRLSHHLRELGVGPEVCVGLCLERSFDLLVGLLAVLKAGGAYVPLDAAYPRERLAFMLADAGVKLVVTQTSVLPSLPASARPICVDQDATAIATRPDTDRDSGVSAENLAYIIYTSGSTGRPKGVAMPHRPLVNLISWQTQRSGLSRPRTVLQFAPVSFDVSVQEIFSVLSSGATVVLLPEEMRKDPLALVSYVEANVVQRIFIPVAALHQLAELPAEDRHKLREISDIITAGEQLQVTAAVRSLFANLAHASLHNHYGPAETHAVTSYQLDGPPPSWPSAPPIGRPISNARVYVLDAHLEPVPMGVIGDLYIGGDSLARGYLGRPALTADRFIPDPFSPKPGTRMYRTGDRARVRQDGVIEFLGRLDHQVKVRGFRIELGEIEAVLGQHPGVVEAAVAVHENYSPPLGEGRVGAAVPDRRLVAYVILAAGDKPATPELRQYLRDRIPEYMVPSAFVGLDRLPLTPSGKVDRRALPAPDRARPDLNRDFVPAGTEVEQTIVDVWTDVLGVEPIGRDDNFFDLGGHSLLATQAVSRLRSRLGVDLGVRDLFEAPTPNGLALRVQQLSAISLGEEPPLARGIAEEPFPVSYGQERIWFLDQSQPGSALYNVSDIYPIVGRFDQAALAQSLTELCRRHESLRTTFELVNGRPVPVVAGATSMPLAVVDLSGEPDPQAAAAARADEEAQRPFDVTRGPLFRVLVFRLGPERYRVLLTMHHIITDGWSMNLLLRELQALDAAFRDGQSSPLGDPAVRYVDYVAWQRQRMEGRTLARDLSYWTRQLTGAPNGVRLRGDRRPPSVPSHRGATQGRLVPAELAERLRQVGKPYGASLFMTLLATFYVLLHRNSGERDLVVGIAVANRSRPELEGVVGLFANLLVLRVQVDATERFEQLLGQVREMTLGAYEHQELPYEKLVEALRPERARSFNPLFNVAFSHNASEPADRADRGPVTAAPADDDARVVAGPSRYDLVLATADAPGGFRISFDYSRDLFDDATVRHILDDLMRLLESVVEDPRRAVNELTLRTSTVAAR